MRRMYGCSTLLAPMTAAATWARPVSNPSVGKVRDGISMGAAGTTVRP